MAEEKEIDLIDIITYLVDYGKRKSTLIISIFVLCIALPCVYFAAKQKYMSSKITITTNSTPFTLVEEIASPLQLSIKYNQHDLAGKLMNSDIELASRIEAVEIKEVEPHPAERREGSTFTVEIISADESVFSEMETPILYYFNNNEFIKRITDVKLDQMKKLHSEITKQIQRLDSIQRSIPKSINTATNDKTMWNDLNLGTVYQQMLVLKARETETMEEIELIEEFKTVSGFTIIAPTKSWAFYIGIGLLGGVLLNVGLLLLAAIGQLINRKKTA